MTYFDTSLDFEPVTEGNTDPILPEERFIFELVGLERSEPDQWRKKGGIKWTWNVYYPDGSPFYFKDEPYTLFRTTGINERTMKPVLTVGTYANDWASAMLGRQLGVDDTLKVSELRGKRMMAMVVWEKQKSDPKKKSVKLASLKHVPVPGASQVNEGPVRRDPTTVSANPTPADVDRALAVQGLLKSVARLKKLDEIAGAAAEQAVENSELDTAAIEDIQELWASVKAAITKAMDD